MPVSKAVNSLREMNDASPTVLLNWSMTGASVVVRSFRIQVRLPKSPCSQLAVVVQSDPCLRTGPLKSVRLIGYLCRPSAFIAPSLTGIRVDSILRAAILATCGAVLYSAKIAQKAKSYSDSPH